MYGGNAYDIYQAERHVRTENGRFMPHISIGIGGSYHGKTSVGQS